jgi:hypothetical protein
VANYDVAHFDDIEAARCPCGYARRVFAPPDSLVATRRIVEASAEPQAHFRKPRCRHRVVGELRFVSVCILPFDPADEWFD